MKFDDQDRQWIFILHCAQDLFRGAEMFRPLAVPRTLLTCPTAEAPPAPRALTLRACRAQALRALNMTY